MRRDLEHTSAGGDVEHERLGAIEAQHVQPLEGNRLAQRHRQTCDDVTEAWRLGDESGDGRQHCGGIGTHGVGPTSIIPRAMTRRHLQIGAALALLVAAGLGVRWCTSPERQIRAILDSVASAFTHDGTSSGLDALTAVAALQRHLALAVTIETAGGARIDGRQDVITAAARLRAASTPMRVRFFDPRIGLRGDDAATVVVTAEVTTRTASGQDAAEVHQVTAAVQKSEGRWVVSSAAANTREPQS